MFFRREKPHVDTFQERIDSLKPYKFTTASEGSGKVRVMRNGIGAIVSDATRDCPHVDVAGLVMGSEIGELVNGGYQQYWLTPTKKRAPAPADQLKALHAFEEDMKEALGLSSLFNTSLGTISALHLYDRAQERDARQAPKPWQIRLNR
jgi:hypothetical protein